MSHTILYTDGSNSLKTGFCGWAVVGLINGQMVRHCGYSRGTNQFAELMGFLSALRLVPHSQMEGVIFTDSMYVINGLTTFRLNWERNGYKNVKGQDIAHKEFIIIGHKLLDERPNIKVRYVPGHKGFQGNELADQLAKKARYFAEGKIQQSDVDGEMINGLTQTIEQKNIGYT
jgi:ribonuclease HI